MSELGQPALFPRHLLQRNLPLQEEPDLLQRSLFIRRRVLLLSPLYEAPMRSLARLDGNVHLCHQPMLMFGNHDLPMTTLLLSGPSLGSSSR